MISVVAPPPPLARGAAAAPVVADLSGDSDSPLQGEAAASPGDQPAKKRRGDGLLPGAADAPLRAPAAQSPAKPTTVKQKGRGRGRGKGKGRGEQEKPEAASITRADFLSSDVALSCVLTQAPGADEGARATGGAAEGAAGGAEERLMSVVLPARQFKTGSMGWSHSACLMVDLGAGRRVRVQAQLNLAVLGSKSWQDGEGLAGLPAAAGGAAEAVTDDAEAVAVSAAEEEVLDGAGPGGG